MNNDDNDDEKEIVVYKIRWWMSYSNGIINECYTGDYSKKSYSVNWSTRKGKEWTSEKNLKAHLLKCLQRGINISEWEVLELRYHPTKPINDWVDAKMLCKVLKSQ